MAKFKLWWKLTQVLNANRPVREEMYHGRCQTVKNVCKLMEPHWWQAVSGFDGLCLCFSPTELGQRAKWTSLVFEKTTGSLTVLLTRSSAVHGHDGMNILIPCTRTIQEWSLLFLFNLIYIFFPHYFDLFEKMFWYGRHFNLF